MKAISLCHTIFSAPRRHQRCSDTTFFRQRCQRANSWGVNAGKGTNGRGNIVDENMIELRVRIKEVELEEMGGLSPTTSENWMEWERKYYEHYNKDVFEAIGMLQTCLMNIRPSLALGSLTILLLSVPLSTSVVIYNFIKLIKLLL